MSEMIHTFHDGVLIDSVPLSVEEAARQQAGADARAARAADRALVKGIITDLKAEKARYDEVINSATATSDAKKTARAGKRVADAAINLARFVMDAA